MRSAVIFAFLLFTYCASAQISQLSDEFDRTCSVYDWQNVETVEGWPHTHLEDFDINQSTEGYLTMLPWTTAWYNDYRSNLLFKEVTGNFIFTIHVTASDRAGSGQPSTTFSLAGAMVRTPTGISDAVSEWTPGNENYVFLSIGSANVTNTPKFEVKSTTNSSSNLNFAPVSGLSTLIRIIRIDNAILALHQIDGESFVVRERYDRGDMPGTLQVGLTTYTDWPKVNSYSYAFHNFNTLNEDLDPDPSSGVPFNPDLIGKFDYARYEEVVLPPEYVGLDFSDEAVVSDAEILALFSYASVSTDPYDGWKIWKGHSSDWNDPSNWSGNTMPTAQDSILIPNCNCPEVTFPVAASGSISCSSLAIESGGTLTIPVSTSFMVDLSGDSARLINEGTIRVDGTISVINSTGRTVRNSGEIRCRQDATCDFLD